MRFLVHGCRGSIPVAGMQYSRHGGSTTCIRILSDHLPAGSALILDGGSGLIPASKDLLAEKIERVYILFTHYHWDHTIGLTLSPLIFIKKIPVVMAGPVQDGVGTREMCETLFRQPFFPVDFKEVGSHITHHRFDVPSTKIILFHREGGIAILDRDAFETYVDRGEQMPFESGLYDLDECIDIRMHLCNHPEQTISYRIQERASGRSLVMLTDHENQDGIPLGLRAHIREADTLIADCQYTRTQYDAFTAGFGHGTPDYVVRLAHLVGARNVLLTHHDPGSSDEQLDRILAETREIEKRYGADRPIPFDMARDGMVYDVRHGA